MSSATNGETIVVKTGAAAASDPAAVKAEWKCPMGDRHIHRDDVRKIWKECHEESFWYRALPLSLGSMAVTGGLIYNGVWKRSKQFGPFPKLIVAGILGYAVGKASYVGTCRSKFQKIGIEGGPWSEEGRFGPFNKSGHGHRIIELSAEVTSSPNLTDSVLETDPATMCVKNVRKKLKMHLQN